MWNELEHEIDRRFKEYFDNKDYSAEAKKQLADYAIEKIRKFLYPKKGELYYKENSLGFIYIDNEEIKEWIADFIEISEKEEEEKPFHDYLDKKIDHVKMREWQYIDTERKDKEKIKRAANYYALEYLKEKERVGEEERVNLWTENAEMAWAFVTQLVIEKNGNYYVCGYKFKSSILESRQSIDRHRINKGELNSEIFRRFLRGYNNRTGNFCGSYLRTCIKNYHEDCFKRYTLKISIKGYRKNDKFRGRKFYLIHPSRFSIWKFDENLGKCKFVRKNKIRYKGGMVSLDKPISNDDKGGSSFGDMIPGEDNRGNVEVVINQFINLTKVLSDFTRIHDSMTGRTQNDKIIKWHRFLVFFTRHYVAEICDLFDSSWVKRINRDIDIIFRSHYKKYESKNEETNETHIIDYMDCSVCQTYINCLENEETETEAQSIEEIRAHRPAYVDAVALHKKRCDNELIAERIKKDYLNQYFGHTNLSNAIQEYEKMGQLLRKQGKLDYTDETRDAYLYWINTYGATYGIYSEEELVNRYTGQTLKLRFGRISDEKSVSYLKEVREGGDQLILTEFTTKLTDVDAITRGITQAYRIALMIFGKIYGDENILSAYKEEDYCRIKRDKILKRLRESIG